ncbi:hypothetical protein G6F60_007499 [Rhizopus arrhizus]|nr:hypothetical protein G6F24_005909 [Rhizopus arrhizus]KAG0908819.1 hypothetical protein G6F33_009348 [Rhizopus arrhizus]KAG0955798.1 hypothetical protein G6F32_002528 [Rhizopus arrhizus]KAG1399758.1 hypothetical protein G6F60_007499 [Rhizopus arrhizus]
MSFDIIDAEQCFSKDLTPYHLIQGEFNLLKPYFYANQESPKKKKRKTTPSKADIETAKRHEELRPILMNCLNELKICWKEKNQVEPKEKKGEKNEIDFPSIQQMVEKAQMRFSDEQIYEKIDLVDMIYKDLDIFSVFNKICMNNTDQLKLLEITPTATYLIPPQSTFIMGSMTDGSLEQLSEHVSLFDGVDLVVMDPPWPNKSVHRSSKYETQDIYDLFSLPMTSMLKEGSLVAIWVTNKPKFRNFILKKLFPSWQLEPVSEWVWLKLTTKGECIFPLDSEHKKTYEQLIIGQRCKSQIVIPEKHVIVSVPSLRHSRKPPLQDVLMPYLENKEKPVCLEMFARCLTPGWISWGNECLKFQHLNYFEKE